MLNLCDCHGRITYVIMWREGWKKCSAPQALFTNLLIYVSDTLKIYSMKQRPLRARVVAVKNTALLLSTSQLRVHL